MKGWKDEERRIRAEQPFRALPGAAGLDRTEQRRFASCTLHLHESGSVSPVCLLLIGGKCVCVCVTPPPTLAAIGLTALNNEGLLVILRHRTDVQGVNQTVDKFQRQFCCCEQTNRRPDCRLFHVRPAGPHVFLPVTASGVTSAIWR